MNKMQDCKQAMSKKPIKQSGVIPFRIKNGKVEIMIISTSSQTGWTIPKGHIDPGYSASESAVKEAYEEAGILGDIKKPNIGNYQYEKYGQIFRVKVFFLEVTEKLTAWPEDYFRKRKWVSIKKASKKIGRKNLVRLLQDVQLPRL